MQVIAFSTPARPEWRWRIVDYDGGMVEESYEAFGSMAIALTVGTRRMGELTVKDAAERSQRFVGRSSYVRNR